MNSLRAFAILAATSLSVEAVADTPSPLNMAEVVIVAERAGLSQTAVVRDI